MADVAEDGHVKSLAGVLVERFANPYAYADMNDGSIDWQATYDAMRQAMVETDHMADVLMAGLIQISGLDPWDDGEPYAVKTERD